VQTAWRLRRQDVNVNLEYELAVYRCNMIVPNDSIVLKFEVLYP
jgi:hypothetical protein